MGDLVAAVDGDAEATAEDDDGLGLGVVDAGVLGAGGGAGAGGLGAEVRGDVLGGRVGADVIELDVADRRVLRLRSRCFYVVIAGGDRSEGHEGHEGSANKQSHGVPNGSKAREPWSGRPVMSSLSPGKEGHQRSAHHKSAVVYNNHDQT